MVLERQVRHNISSINGALLIICNPIDPLFYDVYTRISELHLSSIGLDLVWSDVDAGLDESGERWGKSREYFSLPIYRLPIGTMKTV